MLIAFSKFIVESYANFLQQTEGCICSLNGSFESSYILMEKLKEAMCIFLLFKNRY